ncbi:hypothetical protein TNCV_449941 [Trichonephila clavipes]|nr:hypothetical protein TNCV_449941 [Trichonephila clavipes]
MAGLWPYSGSQVRLGSPAMREPTKKPSREPSRLNWKSPCPSEEQRALYPHTLTNVFPCDSKNEGVWKAMRNPSHCRSYPQTPGENRGCCPLSPNYWT